jgi:XTP/dITP diphosphohydrolase
MTAIYACSSSVGKMRDFQLVASELSVSDFELLPLPGLKDIAAPEETADTFEENAADKARYYSQFTDQMVLADDSGLQVAALGGAPGVRSARYAGTGATDEAKNHLLLENMLGKIHREAKFVCALALAQRGQSLCVVTGDVNGELLTTRRGAHGFGYDPLFFYPPFQATFAELDDARKFKVSHRGTALRQMLRWLALLDRDRTLQG